MNNKEELVTNLSNVLVELRSAVDASINMRSRSKEDAKVVAQVWEGFLGSFIQYINKRGKETGQNLIADISFRNIWKR